MAACNAIEGAHPARATIGLCHIAWLDSFACRALLSRYNASMSTVPELHQLSPCPDAPHCVSSQTTASSARFIEALAFDCHADTAHDALLAVVRAGKRTTIISDTGRLIQATYRSLLGFVDDVTLVIDPTRKLIDVKSMSRTGYYDFGVNRRRVEQLRHDLAERLRGSG